LRWAPYRDLGDRVPYGAGGLFRAGRLVIRAGERRIRRILDQADQRDVELRVKSVGLPPLEQPRLAL
jgi:hypothetical protein